MRRRLFERFRPRFADEPVPPWGVVEALLLFAVFFISAWCLRQQDLGLAWVDELRQNFFIFTREPLLQLYIVLFVETFVLKLGAVLIIILYLMLLCRPVGASLGLTGRLQNRSTLFLRFFAMLCIVVAWWEGLDPLSPDLPTPLFFSESATLGNTLAIFSIMFVAPITEEILFRGFMYPAFCRTLGRSASLLLTSLFFTAAHAPQMNGAYEHLWVIFLVGSLLTWQRAVTGSTQWTILLHALYNTSLVLAGFIRFSFYGF